MNTTRQVQRALRKVAIEPQVGRVEGRKKGPRLLHSYRYCQRQIVRRTRGLAISPKRSNSSCCMVHRTITALASRKRKRVCAGTNHSTAPWLFSPPNFASTSRFVEPRLCLKVRHSQGSPGCSGENFTSPESQSGLGSPFLRPRSSLSAKSPPFFTTTITSV